MASTTSTPSLDTPIAIKLALNNGESRRVKLALKDLGATTLPDKLRSLLSVPSGHSVTFERFSDSAGAYISLDSNNPAVYKQLYRAAKAKLKLRIKATITEDLAVAAETGAAHLPAHCYSPPKDSCDLSLESMAAKHEQHLLRGLISSVADPALKAKSSLHDYHQQSPKLDLRSRLPYDPCLSPSITDTPFRSLLDTENPVINEVNGINGNHPPSDYQMQLMLLKQQEKKRLLMARQASEREAEAPVPRSFSVAEDAATAATWLSLRSRDSAQKPTTDSKSCEVGGSFTICCNKCQANIPNAHWHCSTCNAGDFDLCRVCIAKGCLCESENHWLIKRTIKDGKVVNSTTEKIAPKVAFVAEPKDETPAGLIMKNARSSIAEQPKASVDPSKYRTCNSCIEVLEETKFVTCKSCEDFDLCIPCFTDSKHGHHPSHPFASANSTAKLDGKASKLCSPGRNVRHFAICDGCDKDIYGTRHKCLNCPDWDYCSACFKSARLIHPGHRFVPLNEPIAMATQRGAVHYNINCDGPLCVDNRCYIVGDRYKCAVCHDTDFCAKCEALPSSRHNRTHPLIKFKSPVRNVSVTTLGEKENGEQMYTMGDQLPQFTSKATETAPTAASANAATQVQTIAEVKPIEAAKEEPKEDSLKASHPQDLQAHFIRDAVADGSTLPPNTVFQQVWTLRNPGPYVWPPGCSVRYIGGDTMFNVDPVQPASVTNIAKATESNVIDDAVRVGEEINFTVEMKTPQREGKAISYWRLKSADGLPFGHKLWCDIVVKPAEIEAIGNIKEEQTGEASVAKAVKEEEQDTAASTHSEMIFPTLDKESPVSSTHEASSAPVAPSAAASVTSAVTANEATELLEDLNLDDDSTDDDGFMTDEFEWLDPAEDDFPVAVNGRSKK
ncbi:MAG: hypothetical protein Q9220_002062 [cf. Caloplaca sp. 1 TL-2023]